MAEPVFGVGTLYDFSGVSGTVKCEILSSGVCVGIRQVLIRMRLRIPGHYNN